LLMDANAAELAVVEQQHDEAAAIATCGRKLGLAHREATVTYAHDDDAIRCTEARCDSRMQAVVHRTADRPKHAPRPSKRQEALRPTAEGTGVERDDRVDRQALGQARPRLAGMQGRP